MDDEEFHGWLTQMERNFNEGFEEYLKQTQDEEYEGDDRKKREDEKDPFQSFMETMQGNFDKDFDEFMKEMEKEMTAEYTDDDEKTKREITIEIPDSMRDQTVIATTTGRTEYSQLGRTDSYDNFLISVEREATGDFEKFMNGLARLESSGNKKREASKKYELFELWKENERRNALQRYELFRNEGRKLNNVARDSRDAKDERSLTDMVNFFPSNNKQKSGSSRCSDY